MNVSKGLLKEQRRQTMIYVYLWGRLFSFARAFEAREPRSIQIWYSTSSPKLKRDSKSEQADHAGATELGRYSLPHSPSRAVIGMQLWVVYFHDCYCNRITCLAPQHNPKRCQRWLPDETSCKPLTWHADFHSVKGEAKSSPHEQWPLWFFHAHVASASDASETEKSSAWGPPSSSPFSQYFCFFWFIPEAKELSVRADNKIQPRRKIHKQSFPPIRVLSTGRSEPHLIYKLSFWLSIIKTIVAMAIQRVLQLHERQMARLFVGGDVACLPGLSSFVAG